jgi:hypothetical protein
MFFPAARFSVGATAMWYAAPHDNVNRVARRRDEWSFVGQSRNRTIGRCTDNGAKPPLGRWSDSRHGEAPYVALHHNGWFGVELNHNGFHVEHGHNGSLCAAPNRYVPMYVGDNIERWQRWINSPSKSRRSRFPSIYKTFFCLHELSKVLARRNVSLSTVLAIQKHHPFANAKMMPIFKSIDSTADFVIFAFFKITQCPQIDDCEALQRHVFPLQMLAHSRSA